MSHGGRIEIREGKKKKFRPVSHFGLTYSIADNGKKLLHEDLTPADIFYLMLEMDCLF
jgi:hypothetical protein